MSISWSGGINTPALRRFLRDTAADGIKLRAFRLYRKGETVSATFEPFTPEDRMHLYSLSKSFTSLCVGIAEDLGLLSTDERMIDIFPDKAPETVSENLALMTLGDVLSMQSGHKKCHLDQMLRSEDAVKTFLAMPVVYRPGTTFVYSTGGTCVCGAAVERRSGMKLADFMMKYLFAPLGIERPRVLTTADGTHTGGVGIFLEPDALLKLGMLMLRGGEYEGKRIVSERYCRKATSPIADNSCNGTPDWVAGYGYQFWCNARSGFRGDGAYGQLCVVLPEEDTVFALQAEASSMQAEMDHIYELIGDVLQKDSSEQKELEADVRGYYAVSPCDAKIDKTLLLSPNPTEADSVRLTTENGLLKVVFSTAYGEQTLLAGDGKWVESTPMLRYCNPSINLLDPHFGQIEILRLRSSFTVEGDSVLITAKHPDTPHTQYFRFDSDALRISAFLGDLHPGVKEIPYREATV